MDVTLGQRLALVEMEAVHRDLEDLVRRVGDLRSAFAGDVVVDLRDEAPAEDAVGAERA